MEDSNYGQPLVYNGLGKRVGLRGQATYMPKLAEQSIVLRRDIERLVGALWGFVSGKKRFENRLVVSITMQSAGTVICKEHRSPMLHCSSEAQAVPVVV